MVPNPIKQILPEPTGKLYMHLWRNNFVTEFFTKLLSLYYMNDNTLELL